MTNELARLADVMNVALLVENGLDEKLAQRVGAQWTAKCEELAALRASSPVAWRDGTPPKPWCDEWFIAETTYHDRVVLRALSEEYTYDFKTADETYIKADKIKRWMQFPDSEFIAPAALAAAVQVKALEWGPYPNPVLACEDVAVAAVGAFGGHKYQVQRDPDADGYIAFLAPQFGSLFWSSKGHDTLEAAKAAAQADYDARITSALITAPQDDVREALKAASAIELGEPDTTIFPTPGLSSRVYSRDQIIEFANRRVQAALAANQSDGGGKLAPAESPQDRSCAREPIGNTASSGQAVPGVAPGPSDTLRAPRAVEAVSDRQAFERILASLRYDGADINSLTVGEIRRALMDSAVEELVRKRSALAEAVDVMRPFAREAANYDPDEGDGPETPWCRLDMTIGHLRAARAFVQQHEGEK